MDVTSSALGQTIAIVGSPEAGDELVDWMRAHNVPVTREKFIALNWGEQPDPWTADMSPNYARTQARADHLIEFASCET